MDGPNVNISFFLKLQTELQGNEETKDLQLINVGCCGIHVVNGRLKDMSKKYKLESWRIVSGSLQFV